MLNIHQVLLHIAHSSSYSFTIYIKIDVILILLQVEKLRLNVVDNNSINSHKINKKQKQGFIFYAFSIIAQVHTMVKQSGNQFTEL